MLNNKQLIFIIGAPRSGTTWLHTVLASHPEVASTNAELTVFNRYVAPLVKQFEFEQKPIQQGKWRQGLPHLWSRDRFDQTIKAFIEEIYSSLTILPGHKIILDKHPDYSFHTGLIHYYLPNAKFLHLIRDGRDVASSWHKAWKKLGFGNPVFSGACLDWINYKDSARKAKELGPDKYIEVRYENLMVDFNKEIKGILDFCNVSSSPELIDALASKNTGEENMISSPDKTIKYAERKKGEPIWKRTLTKEEQFIANKYLAKDLIKEGYETSANWGLNNLDSAIMYLKLKTKGIARRVMKSA
jgi:hypothetical protein